MSKDWTGNNKAVYTMLGASNHALDHREKHDYYATDPKAIDELLKCESFNHNIWECACGEGHLSKRLKEYGYNVLSTDLIDRGYQDYIIDFLCDTKAEFKGDIITNPPYKFCSEFILKALERIPIGNKVAMFLKIQTLEGGEDITKYLSIIPLKPFMFL